MSSSSFTKIQNLEDGQKKINMIAVVASFRPPSKSQGTDYSCSMSLVDEDGQTVKCILFNPCEDNLPRDCSPGDVICLHRVNVSEFNDRLQIQGSKISSWMLFKLCGIGAIPITNSDNYTLTSSDKERVRQLKRWSLRNNVASGFTGSSSIMNPFTATSQSQSHSGPSAVTQNGTTSSFSAHASSSSDTATSTSASVSSPVRVFKPKSSRFYNVHIKKLSELTPNSPVKVGVCGVVKYFKPPSPSKGKDCYTVLGIIDETNYQDGLECIVFNPQQGKLPVVCSVGEIVLIKGIGVSYFNSVLQGKGHEHTLVGIFSADSSTPLPHSIGNWYELQSSDLSKIESLKQWAIDHGRFFLNTKFEEVTSSHYFNTVCRIASIATDNQLGIQALSVYDGTTLKLPLHEISSSSSQHQWKVENDPNVCYMYHGLINDVLLNGVKNVKVGDTIELVNVFSSPVTSVAEQDAQPEVELKFSNQNVYKGSVRVLSGDCARVQQFLSNIPIPYGPFPVQRPPSNTPKTISTVVNQQSRQAATLKQIKDAPIGSVLYCEVEVVGASSAPLEDFCQLRCSDCKVRYAMPPQMEDIDPCFLMVGEPCINCSDLEECTGTLKYMYLFVLHIRDSTGELRVFVSDKEGAAFLPNLPPTNLNVDSDSKRKLLDVLYSLTGGNDPFFPLPSDPKFSYTRPMFKCCLLTYTSKTEQRLYSLVDTVFSNKYH